MLVVLLYFVETIESIPHLTLRVFSANIEVKTKIGSNPKF